MNLINCGKDCLYQRGGNCTLSGIAYPSGNKVDGCCYYKRRPDAGKKEGH